MVRTAGLLPLMLTIGCGPGLAGDGSESESGSDTVVGDGADGDCVPDVDAGNADGGDGDITCDEFRLECPDGTCQVEHQDHPCCGHGGICEDGCGPQMVSSTKDACGEPLFAWTGAGCEAIHACEGLDCGELYASVGACLAAHEPDCGFIGLDTCPFEMQLGATAITGTTDYGTNEYTVGVFGRIHGDGYTHFHITLATDLVTLGNHLWNTWDPPQTPDVLTLGGGDTMIGEHQIWLDTEMPLSSSPVWGTLTITNIVAAGDYLDHELWATLDVSDGEWQLHGELAIAGCERLEMYLP
jgi:hypothetical protein